MPAPGQDAVEEIEAWLATKIERAPGVIEIARDRVYPVFVPSLEDLPATTYRRAGTSRSWDMRGADGLTISRFVIECLALPGMQGYKQTLRLAKAIRLALDGLKGDDREKGHYIRSVKIDDEADDPEGVIPINGELQPVMKRVLAVAIKHKEQVANNSGVP